MRINFNSFKTYVTPAKYSVTTENPLLTKDVPVNEDFSGDRYFHRSLKLVQVDNCKELNKQLLTNVNDILNAVKVTGYDTLCDGLFLSSSMVGIDFSGDVKKIGDKCFKDCKSLEAVYNEKQLSSIGLSAFANCKNLSFINLGDDIIELDEAAFKNCESIKNVHIPNKLLTLEKSVFENCKSIEELDFSNSNIEELKDNSLMGCESLNSVKLSTNVVSFDQNAFRKCSSLPSLDIPLTVKNIGEGCFISCDNLLTMTYGIELSSEGQWNDKSLSNEVIPDILSCQTFIPDKSISYYKEDPSKYWWVILVPPYMYRNFLNDPNWKIYGNKDWKVGKNYHPAFNNAISTHIITTMIPCSIAVKKIWSSNTPNNKKKDVIINLCNNTIIDSKVLNTEHNYISWNGLSDELSNYTVSENQIEEFNPSIEREDYGNLSSLFTITNTYIPAKSKSKLTFVFDSKYTPITFGKIYKNSACDEDDDISIVIKKKK